MGKESKYYYVRSIDSGYRKCPEYKRWSYDNYITIHEEVDESQFIEMSLYKENGDGFEKPKSTSYEEVKPVLKGIFFDHYNLAIKLLSKKMIGEGEFYILKHKNNWIAIHGYTSGNGHIYIDLRDTFNYFHLTVSSSYGHYDRANCRKDGTPIAKEQFMLIVRLTVKYLFDPDSYKILLDSFLKNYYSLTSEGEEIEDLILSTDQSIKSIIEKLENRKKVIEERLIETDDDSELNRVKLRGEIEGLKYALSTIKIHG